jgi:sulfide:quinone oxidoreductase
VRLTLVSPGEELVLPALSVAEPFALGSAERLALSDLVAQAGAQLVTGTLARVHDDQHRIELTDGRELAYDALLIAAGAQPVERVPGATTWWPRGGEDEFAGLLRDLEEGYSRRVAFVIPTGAVWPLPLYEVALMTARQVASMGMQNVELTIITPEAVPLALFGPEAAGALREELVAAGIGLETATVARVERSTELELVLQPSSRRLAVDRIVALPGVQGPAIAGTTQDEGGFIRVGPDGQMAGSDAVWAAGDAIAYPVKYGGLSTQQADAAAASIATRAGVAATAPERPVLRGVLMTGASPRGLGAAARPSGSAHPLWHAEGKVFGTYLTPFLRGDPVPGSTAPADESQGTGEGGVTVAQPLPAPDSAEHEQAFHALWSQEHGSGDYLRRLGHDIHDYQRHLEQSRRLLGEHGELPRS